MYISSTGLERVIIELGDVLWKSNDQEGVNRFWFFTRKAWSAETAVYLVSSLNPSFEARLEVARTHAVTLGVLNLENDLSEHIASAIVQTDIFHVGAGNVVTAEHLALTSPDSTHAKLLLVLNADLLTTRANP
ncbi:hypothetical protein KAZ57_02030 [Patescibacteria group bacterium]|nr:hypothetical protein [Patescibacteria group bacterium]